MTITSKGQVTVPKNLRDKYGLNEHTEVEFVDEGGAIRLVKKGGGQFPIDSVFGILKRRGGRSDAIVKKLRGE
jgi:AbrB family looped-hinge helix DNA binding protein